MFNVSGYDAYCPFRIIIRNIKWIKVYLKNFVYARGLSGDVQKQHIETINDLMQQAKI